MTIQEHNATMGKWCLAHGVKFVPLLRFPINPVRLAVAVWEVAGPEARERIRAFLLWGKS
jgi:hypothetical protein